MEKLNLKIISPLSFNDSQSIREFTIIWKFFIIWNGKKEKLKQRYDGDGAKHFQFSSNCDFDLIWFIVWTKKFITTEADILWIEHTIKLNH